MSTSYEFQEVTHFTAGAIGNPGQRVFYLQLGDERGHISVRLEKTQVRALAKFLRSVLDDLPEPPGNNPTPVALREPTDPEWVVGQIAVGVDEPESRVVLVIDELVPDAEEDDDDDDELAAELELFDTEPAGARIRAHIDVTQASQFIATADDLMSRGRPPCRLCGQPLDPTGHACPRLN